MFYLGGLPLVWIALPEFIVFSLLSFIKGKYPLYAHRINIGMGILLVGVASLLSHIGLNGGESFSFAAFNEAFSSIKAPSAYFLASSIGGGAIGCFIASIFNFGGAALVYFMSILFILSGLIIVFFPLEKKAYSSFLSYLAIRKSKIKSEKERERQEEEYRKEQEREALIRPIENEMPRSPFSAASIDNQVPPFLNTKKEEVSNVIEEETLSKRTDLYHHEKPVVPPTQIRVNDNDPSFINATPFSLMNAGLQEASYMPEAAFLKKSVSSEKGEAESMARPKKELNQTSPVSLVTKREESPIASKPSSFFETENKEEPSHKIIGEEPNFIKNESIVSSISSDHETSFKEETKVEDFSEKIDSEKEISSIKTEELSIFNEQSLPLENSPISSMKEEEKIDVVPTNDNSASEIETMNVSPYVSNAPETKEKKIDFDPITGEKFATPLPNYVYPSEELLTPISHNDILDKQKEECTARMDSINEILASFKSGAHVTSFTIGPSVTRFNIETESGVTVSSIKRYIQNIQVKLGGIPTRFEEVVPGEITSGLEIANANCRSVSMREIIESLPELNERTKLYIPFGESISGKIISGDLSKFPHMLISGGTGSGKSVYMQSVIMSLIMRNRPEELKLVMVDPKRVEMSKYDSIPHLLCPIVKEMSQAKICIDKLCHEMERRYMVFEKAGVRDIFEYNEEYAKRKNLKLLPFIVCIIDEFADLMDTYKNVEDPVVRIAQKARAAGIHLIIATQRPTVNVVTGRLKANLTVRVALSMNAAVDSVTILGEAGAEELAGHGDMLVSCPEVLRNGLIRAQGAFVATKEIQAVTDFIRSQSKPQYDPYFLDLVDHEAEMKAAEEAASAAAPSRAELNQMATDELYATIKENIMTLEYASVSRIQREYNLGFPRAGKIFVRLQREGIVAPAPETNSSSKGCKVLIHSESKNSSLPGGSSDNSEVQRGDY